MNALAGFAPFSRFKHSTRNNHKFLGPDKRKSKRKAADAGHGTVSVSSIPLSLGAVFKSGCGAFYEHWDACRGDRFAPTWQELDLCRLPPDQISFTHMVEVSSSPFDIIYRFWGTGLGRTLSFDRTGQSLLTTELGYPQEARRTQVLSDYRDVLETRAPMPFLWDASVTREYANRMIVPSIRLPLSSDRINVTHVVTHFDFASQNHPNWKEIFRASRDGF